ncbi:Peptidase S10, serine carboxypeptidase [Dillenia turbinata]|uniref:Carboxypeptidase n=1 Tax=Dillenia turbinata TaxID=194707 RepID=A0AAN8VAR8_9MAGN
MKSHNSIVLLLLCISMFYASVARIPEASESWGYVEVRPKAHMFWWLYSSPYRVEDPSKPWPIILWLQGGPGDSGVINGNFLEIGPLDFDLRPRNSTWLKKADLLFVDNPVGVGFSYVEEETLLVKTDEEAAADLTTLLIEIFNRNESLQKSPLFMVGESYGGKFAVTLALSTLKAIQAEKLKLKLGGVALGNSWISPEDFVLSWGPVLKDISRLDDNGLQESNRLAEEFKKKISEGKYLDAMDLWDTLQRAILYSSNWVDVHNFLLDDPMDPISSSSATELLQPKALRRYSKYLSSLKSKEYADANEEDFINDVDELLAAGVNVTIYNGQVDLMCCTKGVHAWVEKLKWAYLKSFQSVRRTPLYCGDDEATKGFSKSFKNLHFYWILNAGHHVPIDQPCISLKMAGEITGSPATSASI